MTIASGIDSDTISGKKYLFQIIYISGNEITRHRTPLPDNLEKYDSLDAQLQSAKLDIDNLIYQLLSQQNRIEELEKHLSQYTTK